MIIAPFPSHCGSKIFHQLWDNESDCFPSKDFVKTIFGIFVDDPRQKKTYKTLQKKYKVLYQSPVLISPMTNREYFIVIWLNEKP